MKKSLYTKISILFAATTTLVVVLFITFGRIQTYQALERMKSSQINSIDYLVSLYEKDAFPRDLHEYFHNFNLEMITDRNLLSNVLASKEIVFEKTQR